MPNQAPGAWILWFIGQDRIVRSGNYCCSSIRVASVDENKNSNRKITMTHTQTQEWINLWKQHFENLLGNPPNVTYESITRIISKQLDIKLGPFTQEELDLVLRKIKNRNAEELDKIPPGVWKVKQFDDIQLRHCNAVYNQNPIDRWTKGCILPFHKKRRTRISQELPRYNPYINSGQDIQCSTTQLRRTQNWEHT